MSGNPRHAARAAKRAKTTPSPMQGLRRRSPGSSPGQILYARLWRSAARGGGIGSCGEGRGPSMLRLEDELEIAASNKKIWDRIDHCQRRIERYEDEINRLRKELDRRTMLQRLFAGYARRFWDDEIPASVKHDLGFAWAVIGESVAAASREKADADASRSYRYNPYDIYPTTSLPLRFQEMLWVDEFCPLRDDRELLMASLHSGLDKQIRVRWTDQLANDRGILLKIFARCPWCLDDADVPQWCLDDADLLRAFSLSNSVSRYRHDLSWVTPPGRLRTGIVTRFSPSILHKDPNLHAELILQGCQSQCNGIDCWAQWMTSSARIKSAVAIRVAEGMSRDPSRYIYSRCKARYEALSPRLQRRKDVVLAFVVFDDGVTTHAPHELREDVELWTEAVRRTPRYARIQIPSPTRHFPLKLFYLLLLEDFVANSSGVNWGAPDFSQFPPDAAKDRNFASHMLRAIARGVPDTSHDQIVAEWGHDRAFWIDLATTHRCPQKIWNWIPGSIRGDPAVRLAWARHSTDMCPRWVEHSDLSDRQVLLNCLPSAVVRNHNVAEIWRRVDTTVLDRPLTLELISRFELDTHQGLGPEGWMSFWELLPEVWRNDLEVLRACLRAALQSTVHFSTLFGSLSVNAQLLCADLLVEAIQRTRVESDEPVTYSFGDVEPEVFHLPKVAHAALSRGWSVLSAGFYEAVEEAPWSLDPDFLLEIAQRHSAQAFWECSPDHLRRSKDLIVKAVRVNSRVWHCLKAADEKEETDEISDLMYDFDVLCTALGCSSDDSILASWPRLDAESRRDGPGCRFPTARLVSFGCELRRRLALAVPIEVVMSGIRCGSSSSSPLSLLDQDAYTQGAFQRCLTDLLGAPSMDDAAVGLAIMRSASNALSRYGF